jgi:phage-related protein
MAPKKVPARFYLTASGGNPVRDWLMGLPLADRRHVGHDVGAVEYGWPVGMPLCRSLGDGLWEVRSSLPSRRVARVLFCVVRGELILLHGFVKKTQKTPPDDLALARKRQKEVER